MILSMSMDSLLLVIISLNPFRVLFDVAPKMLSSISFAIRIPE